MSDHTSEPTDALEEALVAYDVACEGNLFGTSGAGAYQLALHLHAAGFRRPDELADLERDRRLLAIWAEGYVAGGYNVCAEIAGPALAGVGYHHAMHALGHLTEDPLARAQIIERLVHHWTTGEQAPAERVDIHGMAHRNPEAEE